MARATTGRIHATYWQLGSQSGRYACSKPNIQQVPRSLPFRGCFIPDPGNKFIVADYSQVELRAMAQISQDKDMIKAYVDGKDLHRLTASLISGIRIT